MSNLDYCQVILDQVVAEIQHHKVDYFLHLGDLKSVFNPVDVRVTNFLIHTVQVIKKHCPVLILLGNHDRAGPQDHFPSIAPTLESAGAVVFDAPAIYPLSKYYKMYAVPYIRDHQKLQQYLNAPHDSCRILALHASIHGCQLNTSFQDKGPETVALNNNSYSLCLAGHIHMPQYLPPNIYYVGSPFPDSWGEANQIKSLMLIDSEYNFGPLRIATNTPIWWDPDLPGFNKLAAQSKPCRIRIRVPFESNEQVSTVGAQAKNTYPKATIHLIPVFSKDSTEAPEDLSLTTDASLIRRFLERNPSLVDDSDMAVEYLTARLNATGTADTFHIRGLKLKSCTASNVLCFEDVSLKLDTPGITLVTGDNRDWPGHGIGSGKSSLLALLVIALFGSTPKGQKHNQWLHRGTKRGFVKLDIQLLEDRTCTIERKRPADLRITVNGKDMAMGDVNATQKLIEKLTGLTWDVLVNALYITQNEVGTILTGTEKERQQLFSRFLGLERFIQCLDAVRTHMRLVESIIEDLEVEKQHCGSQVELYNRLIQQAQSPAQYISQKDHQRLLNALRQKLNDTAETKEDNAVSKVALERSIAKLEAVIRSLADQRVASTTKSKIFNDSIENLSQLDQKTKCPLCGSPVRASELGKHKLEISIKLQELEAEQEKLSTQLQAQQTAYEKKVAQLNYFESCILNRRLDAERIRAQITALNAQRQHSKDMETISAKHYIEQRSWKKKLSHHQAYRKQLLADYKFLEGCSRIVARDGLPAFLCSTVCPQLNQSAAKFSEAFSDSEIQVQFAVTEGSIDVQVQNLHGGAEIVDQSRGEMQLAALTAAFALRDVLAPLNVLILDEPSEGMDPESARTFAEAMNNITKNARFGSIILVSHNPHILSTLKPDRHLEVVKSGGVAKVFER